MESLPRYCETYGFDARRRKARLSLLGLSEEDRPWVSRLQEEVIGPHNRLIIERFYETLQTDARFNEILERGYDVRALKATQRDYLLSLGVGFDRTDYFESRLRVGLAHARVGVPLGLYQCAYRLMQQLLIDRIREAMPSRGDADRLTDLVLKITALDISLAVETYHRRRVDTLKDSLDELEREGSQLRLQTQVDSLTGVASRERLFEVLETALCALRRDDLPVCVVMGDLDRFKQINDDHGHLTGDAVLEDVAGRIRSAVRDFDVVGRYGGEEFVIVLQNTPLRSAHQITERVRERVAASPIHAQGVEVPVTISLGVALARPDDDPNSLIDRADAAMYAAKAAGRNCVMVAEDDAPGR